jgi:ABC-type multidrug transport system ATPase subunit
MYISTTCLVIRLADDQLIIIASIHQPSTSTFNKFDKVYLLAKGHMCYGGPRRDIASYFHSLGYDLPEATNPAEWILELVDTDFARNKDTSSARLDNIIQGWETTGAKPTSRSFLNSSQSVRTRATRRETTYTAPLHLLHRNWIKSYRDILPYWVRVAMYTCKHISFLAQSSY